MLIKRIYPVFVSFSSAVGVANAAAPDVAAFRFRDGDRVVLIGNALIEAAQLNGHIEAQLTSRLADRRILFRNLGWSGDTVFGESRVPGRTGAVFGTAEQGFATLLRHVHDAQPTVVLVGYGFNESFAGPAGLERFTTGVDRLLDALEAEVDRIVVLSPIRQRAPVAGAVDPASRNEMLRLYGHVLRTAAGRRGHTFVDLFTCLGENESDLTTQLGILPSEAGYRRVAACIARRLAPDRAHWRLSIDSKGTVRSAAGVSVVGARSVGSGLRLDLLDHRLPVSSYPSTLQVTGLTEGRYRLRIDGRRIVDATHQELARGVAIHRSVDDEQHEALRMAIIKKNRLFFHSWRPRNTAFITGERRNEQVPSHADVPNFSPLVAQAEARIAQLKMPVQRRYELERIDAVRESDRSNAQ